MFALPGFVVSSTSLLRVVVGFEPVPELEPEPEEPEPELDPEPEEPEPELEPEPEGFVAG